MGRLVLVRHGQASFGADDYDVLSPTGWEQGRVLGRWLAGLGVEPTAVVRGGMRRHRETLEAMADAGGWALEPAVDPDWDEFDHVSLVAAHPGAADAAALDRRGFQRLFEEATARWTAGEDGAWPETYAGFLARVGSALERAVAAAGSGETVVVVTSGGPIAACCAALLAPDPAVVAGLWGRFNTVLANSSLTRVVVGPHGPRLLTFNEHAHLGTDLLTYR
jgi:broad specificity phosphatase PhoE